MTPRSAGGQWPPVVFSHITPEVPTGNFALKFAVGEVGATPKLLSLDIKRIGKEIPGLISDGVCWKPRQLPFKHTKQFPKIFFRLGAGAKNTKKGDFRRCLEIAGKAENARKFIGAKPKIYYIKLAQYFSSFAAGTLLQNIYTLGVTVCNI